MQMLSSCARGRGWPTLPPSLLLNGVLIAEKRLDFSCSTLSTPIHVLYSHSVMSLDGHNRQRTIAVSRYDGLLRSSP